MKGRKTLLAPIAYASTLVVLAGAALAIVWSSLATIANFAFRYPAFDQYRLYQVYLGLPFPQNAIQDENGHRPVLPALIKLAEIRWFAADQGLQIGLGVGFVISTFALVVAALLRDRSLHGLQRGAGILVTALAIFWLGNARMLMHGNELICTYLVLLMLVLIAWTLHAARQRAPVLWLAMGALCALVATFSFGTGMACFPALFIGAILAGLPRRAFIVPAFLFVGAMTTYVFNLPGNAGVRNVLDLDPFGNVVALVRWLSSPWMNAWLGLADPPLTPFVQQSALRSGVGHLVVGSARIAAHLWGDMWMMRESLAIGFFGIAAWLFMLGHAWVFRDRLNRIRLFAVVLGTIGLASGAIVCVARLHLFQSSPMQVFADRYLPWSCIFWLGLALYAGGSPQSTSRSRGIAFSVAACLCALIATPTQKSMAGWSATVHRHIEQSAVAAQLGLWDAQRFPDGDDASREDTLASLALLRKFRLSMFSEPAYHLFEDGWRASAVGRPPLEGANAHVVREFDDTLGNRRVADFEGWMPRIDNLPHDPVLAVVDDAGTLRGLAKLSFLGPAKTSLRFSVARQGGFDGYVLEPIPGEQLHVLVLDASNHPVATIPLAIPVNVDPQVH